MMTAAGSTRHPSRPRLSLLRNQIYSLLILLIGSVPSIPLLAGKVSAKDIEGSVSVDYHISTSGSSGTVLCFIEGAKEGLDNYDLLYYELPYPTDSHVKAVGSIEGKEADGIALPPLTDTPGSSGGTSFSGSIVVNSGRSVTLNKAAHYLTASYSGLEGCTVYVNGIDISKKSTINLGTLTGTYGEGEHSTASWSVDVRYNGTNNGGGGTWDPNNGGGVVPNLDAGPHILRIDNVHEKSPTSTWRLVYKAGATDGSNDLEDKAYPPMIGIPPPYIGSNVDGKILRVDVRNTKSVTPVDFKQMYHSDIGFGRIPGGDTNALVFSLPEDEGANGKFEGRVITFREYDPNDPNATFPTYVIRDSVKDPKNPRDLITDGNGLGVIPLDDLPKRINAGTLYSAKIDTHAPSRAVAMADFNGNGRVDANDISELEGALGYVGASMYDIASLRNPLALLGSNDYGKVVIGIRPDGKVDELDRKTILYLRDEDSDPNEAPE